MDEARSFGVDGPLFKFGRPFKRLAEIGRSGERSVSEARECSEDFVGSVRPAGRPSTTIPSGSGAFMATASESWGM